MSGARRVGWGLWLLAGLHLASLLAGFLAPYHYATQNRDLPYAPPTPVRFIDGEGRFHLRPFVHGLQAAGGSSYREDPASVHPLRFLVRGESYRVLGLIESDLHLVGVEEPGRLLLFGSDGFGRDQLSRLLYGSQISLFAGLLAALCSLLVGTLLGVVAGYFGGWADRLLMRLVELFLALPWLYLLLAARAFLPLDVSAGQTFFLLVAIIGLVGWARPARLVRGVVLSAKERGYVAAARGFGAGAGHVIRRHILPQTAGVVLTQAAILVPRYILAEVTLSFLGLGIAEPVPSWGNLLAELQSYHVLVSYWWAFLPAVALVGVFLIYHLLARSLQAGGRVVTV